jgi:ABC-type enterochelin transport system substrate-binding protein
VSELTKYYADLVHAKCNAKIADLSLKLAEVAIDANWLIDNNAMVVYGGKMDFYTGKSRHGFWVSWPDGERKQIGIYATSAEAIAAARKQVIDQP